MIIVMMSSADIAWKMWYIISDRCLVEKVESLFSVNEMLKAFNHYASNGDKEDYLFINKGMGE